MRRSFNTSHVASQMISNTTSQFYYSFLVTSFLNRDPDITRTCNSEPFLASLLISVFQEAGGLDQNIAKKIHTEVIICCRDGVGHKISSSTAIAAAASAPASATPVLLLCCCLGTKTVSINTVLWMMTLLGRTIRTPSWYQVREAAAAEVTKILKEVPWITSYVSDVEPRSRRGFMYNPCLTSLITRRAETLPQQICSKGNERKQLLLQALWVLLALTLRLSLRNTELGHGSANGNSWTGVSGIRRSTALAFSRCRESCCWCWCWCRCYFSCSCSCYRRR